MNCRGCGYALWNLRESRCPECARPFLPSEFEFVVSAVRFQCPHCLQSYYGTGPKGHLEPPRFACVKCHREVEMDQMLLLPSEGVKEEQTVKRRIPWLERSRRGFFRGWLGTVGMAMFLPDALIRGADPVSGGSAFWFAVLNALVPLVVLCASTVLFMAFAGSLVMGAAILGLGGFALYAALLGIWGLVAHGILRLTGPVAGGPLRTFRPILLASAPIVLCVVPCFGPYALPVALVWWTVSAIIMLVVSQRVRVARALLAGGLLPVLLMAAMAGLVVYSVVGVNRAVAAARAGMATMPAALGSALSADLQTYATTHNGQYPAHGLELLLVPGGRTITLVVAGSSTTDATIPVGGTTLDLVMLRPVQGRLAAAQAAAAALPPNVVAHRLGDVVFTYHGITASTPNTGLWLYVVWPDPFSNVTGTALTGVVPVAGCADGTVVVLPLSGVDAALAAQNSLRTQAGLPALPHPNAVTHALPATSP